MDASHFFFLLLISCIGTNLNLKIKKSSVGLFINLQRFCSNGELVKMKLKSLKPQFLPMFSYNLFGNPFEGGGSVNCRCLKCPRVKPKFCHIFQYIFLYFLHFIFDICQWAVCILNTPSAGQLNINMKNTQHKHA